MPPVKNGKTATTSKEDAARLKKLMDKGYSRPKVKQALIDGGNNPGRALQLLELRARRPATPAAPPVEHPPCPHPAAETDDVLCKKKKVPLHPCIAQHKKCKFGDACDLKDYPGDTCLAYYQGKCWNGEHCWYRHVVDGVDIRESRRPQIGTTFRRDDGTYYEVLKERPCATLQRAVVVDAPDTPPSSGGHAESADTNHTGQLDAVNTDSLSDTNADVTPTYHPTPFLEAAKAVPAVAGPAVPLRVTAPVEGTSRKHTTPSPGLHPCVVQHGQCNYGDQCRFADRDGDVCLFFLRGRCKLSATQCTHRHETEEEYNAKKLQQRPCATVQSAIFVDARDTPPSSGSGGNAESADTNHTRQLDAVNTDSLSDTNADVTPTYHPTPFLEAAKAVPAVAGPAVPLRVTAPVEGTSRKHTTPSPGLHPCVVQHGQCNYDDQCRFADRDGDVCLFFLRGRCKLSATQCTHRHETEEEYNAKKLQRNPPAAELPPPLSQQQQQQLPLPHPQPLTQRALNEQVPDSSETQPNPFTALEFGATVRCSDSPADGSEASVVSGADARRVRRSAEADGEWATFGRLLDSLLLQDAHLVLQMVEDARARMNNKPQSTLTAFIESDSDSSLPPSPLPEFSSLAEDKELHDFQRLLEIFPSEEPFMVLHALRGSGGDPEAVTDRLVNEQHYSATDYALALAVAAAEEEDEETERVQREGAARTDCLLALCSLFPTVELDAVEAALDRSGNDLSSAYEALFCMQAKIEKQAYGTVWRGNLSPLEMLRLEKLYAMFPKMDADVVRSTYGATGKNWSNTVAALNSLTDELLNLEGELLPVGADSNKGVRGCRTALRARQCAMTIEDAARMLKAADKELREYGDWRRVRDRAYLVNKCRLDVLAQAAAAYAKGDGALAKTLSREGRDLAVEYNRLNRLAMLALERERQENDPLTTLDLHFFHVEEALEVLTRRVEYCSRKNISRLRIVLGEGKPSMRDGVKLYFAVVKHLNEDPFVSSCVNIVSVKTHFVDTRVKCLR